MAQYFTDFSEYTVDALPSDWTVRYASSSWEVKEVATSPGGKTLRSLESVSGHQGCSWDAVDADPDRAEVEVVALIEPLTTATGTLQGAMLRGSGATSGTADCYSFREAFDLRLDRIRSGSFDLLGWKTKPFAWYDRRVWVRLQMYGTALKARHWEDGTNEPADWDIEATDSAFTAPGWVGLINWVQPSFDCHAFGVGTNGDSAPQELVVATGPYLRTASGYLRTASGILRPS